ncbi:MAG: DNA-directed RNA polymerase subunit beta' [Clostridia bacterium]|nr:DNA-directed RNA polymerase subunit beta' [Clostridia bacterium]
MSINKGLEVQSVSALKSTNISKQGIMNDFASIQIGIASPEKIREWSFGEVTKAETINYRTQKPEKDGLFCEKIFGPTKDWECHCGKYKRIRYKGIVCEKCGVKVTKRKVRRERMGHIELAAPVSHIWYLRGVPSRMGLILGMSPKDLEALVNFQEYVILTKEEIGLPSTIEVGAVISQSQYEDFKATLKGESCEKEFVAITKARALAKYIHQSGVVLGEQIAQVIARNVNGDNLDEYLQALLSSDVNEELKSALANKGDQDTLTTICKTISSCHDCYKIADVVCSILTEKQEGQDEVEDLLKVEIANVVADALGKDVSFVTEFAHEQMYEVVETITKSPLKYKRMISIDKLRGFQRLYGYNKCFRAGTGAESVRELLQNIDLDKEAEELRAQFKKKKNKDKESKETTLMKRLDIVEAFRRSGNKPEWMVLTVLPVLPPDLRPMVPLDGGRYAASDLNDLYRRVINRNNRLKRLIDMNAPESLLNNEKRMLQDAVDSLIDNSRAKRPQSGSGSRELKSLTSMLKGKQGRFRQNLLGKRVDYSGRSVIVVGPELKMHQCGIPKEMALELFKPFVMKKLVQTNQCHNVKSAKKRVERADATVWDILENVIKEHPVMLNRAPTLHRLSIQAFEPVLIEGRAIKLHPLVCPAFNADFDGDQMAVHVPLSLEAQTEARYLMLAANNILKLSDGKPIVSPTQDMILGCYYLSTVEDVVVDETASELEKFSQYHRYSSFDEAYLAYVAKDIKLQTLILVKRPIANTEEGRAKLYEEISKTECPVQQLLKKYMLTTVGRMILFKALPPYDLENGTKASFNPVDEEHCNKLGISVELTHEMIARREHLAGSKKNLSKIVEACFNQYGTSVTATMLDNIKALGYKYSTISGLTTSVFDMHVPQAKSEILARAESAVDDIETNYEDGFLQEEERHKAIVDVWSKAFELVTNAVKGQFESDNPIKMMNDSGARGNVSQLVQLCGMRGLMSDTTGKTIELPIKSCFREGLSVLEYFISSHGGRKGLADTALKTADSGYLTRRLVDVSHQVIITEDDCCKGSRPVGRWVEEIRGSAKNSIIENFYDRIIGKYYIGGYKVKDLETGKVETYFDYQQQLPLCNPKTGEVLCGYDEMITPAILDSIKALKNDGIEIVAMYIRTVLTCKSKTGICAKCYGKNMANSRPVQKGEAVGVIAAQSIGEPGTQLTMRTFHTGGVASADDITQGLPRVVELFEARKPKGCATISEISGTVSVKTKGNKRIVSVMDDNGREKIYNKIPYSSRLKVQDGQRVNSGDALTEGPIDPKELLQIKGLNAAEEYLLDEVQVTYRGVNGVEIDDKHVEVIIRQMLRRVLVLDAGDTDLLPGEKVDLLTFDEANQKALQNGGVPATAQRIMQGIAKAALSTDGFLSASSFQETPRVLTEAAIKNKKDYLLGLKENVIIGKLISAGTGFKEYRETQLVPVVKQEQEEYQAEELVIEQDEQ